MKHFFTTFQIIYIIRKTIYTEQVTPPPKKRYMELFHFFQGFFQGGGYPTATWLVPTGGSVGHGALCWCHWFRRGPVDWRGAGWCKGQKRWERVTWRHLGRKSREHLKKRSRQLWEFSKGNLHFFSGTSRLVKYWNSRQFIATFYRRVVVTSQGSHLARESEPQNGLN